jgi:phosphatidylglycerophosphate synthase
MTLRDRALRAVPNALTCLGHLLTLAWLSGAPWPVGLAGLACDALDGPSARRLGATSAYGARYDWTVDVTCAAVLAAHLHVLPVLVLLVPAQVLVRQAGRHVSGRALLMGIAMATEIAGGSRG